MLRVSEDGNRRHDGSIAKYNQLRQSLLHLQQAADRIFDTISVRVVEEREKLSNISTRIQNAKGKIDLISRSNRSMTVKSPSRYPSKAHGEEDYRPLFIYKSGPGGSGYPVGNLVVNGGLNREFGVDGTLELFQFFSETACESFLNEVQSKASNGVIHSKGDTNSEYLVVPPKIPNSSFLVKDHTSTVSSCKPKKQGLPPPPPSLFLHNSRLLPRPESFSFKPAVKQLQSFTLPDILPDLLTVSNSEISGVGSLFKISEDNSRETGSSTLAAGRAAIYPSTALLADSKRNALLASIHDPGIVLRKTGVLDHSSTPTTPSSPLQKDTNSSGHENIPGALKPKAEHVENASPSALRPQSSSPLAANLHDSDELREDDYWDD